MTADEIKLGLSEWRENWPPNVFEFSEACKPKPVINAAAYKEYKSIAPIVCSEEEAKSNIIKLKKMIKGAA